MNYVDPNTVADNPGGVTLSRKKLNKIMNMLNLNLSDRLYFCKQKKRIQVYMEKGDVQPAVVCSVSPLLVAAYSDEMDAVVMLSFPQKLAEIYNLSVGTRLVTSNVYKHRVGFPKAPDIFIGEDYLGRYSNFTPIIQLFLSDDEEYIKSRVNIFTE